MINLKNLKLLLFCELIVLYSILGHFSKTAFGETPQITIIEPNGQEVWIVNNSYDIKWQSSGITGYVAIAISIDRGAHWIAIDSNTENDGIFTWTPDTTYISDQCLIRIVAKNEGIPDRSDAAFTIKQVVNTLPDHWNYTTNTGINACIILSESVNPTIGGGQPLAYGDYIGVFTPDGLCCGWKQWKEENLALIAWGDNTQTPEKDGFQANEFMEFRIYSINSQQEWTSVNVSYSQGMNYFISNAIYVFSKFYVGDVQGMILQLKEGWSMFSINVDPADPDFESIMAPIKEQVVIVKDGSGKTYLPEYNINEIGDINFKEGYQLYVKNQVTLEISGSVVDPATPIELNEKWNMISYLPEISMDITVALESIKEDVIIVEDGKGHIYLPDYNINEIGDMQPGEGYRVYLKNDATLVYPSQSLSETWITNSKSALMTTEDALGDMDELSDAVVPSEFELLQNYPNPFNPETIFEFRIPQATKVVLTVYDSNGRFVTTLVNEEKQAGSYRAIWNAKDHPSGLYLCKIKAGHFEKSMKLMLVK